LAFDIVHAVEFSRIGRAWILTFRPSFRATALTYHLLGLTVYTGFLTAKRSGPCVTGSFQRWGVPS